MVSICVIGSVARQTDDPLSDKDILAVGCPREIESSTYDYIEGGWNVSSFSTREFEEMAREHSLFVQHVKQDGQIVRDDFGYLHTLLKCYEPKQSYYDELSSAIGPLLFMDGISSSYWGLLFQADILYVAIRNACILHRATDASPNFDFAFLVEWIAEVVDLTEYELSLLLNLRKLKHAYRKRELTADPSCVQEIANVGSKLANNWSNIVRPSIRSIPSNGYYEVRELEKRLVSTVGPIFMDSLSSDHQLYELWQVIRNPSVYDKPKLISLPMWERGVSDFLKSHHLQ